MSNRFLALRDRRLSGGVPARRNLCIHNTDQASPLSRAFSTVNAYAGAGRIHTIYVFCHGYAGENTAGSVCGDFGGMGLQLGREDVYLSNVNAWIRIKNRVENIVIHACGAADTQHGNESTDADGQRLMGSLAIHTNATVWAADRIQWYNTHNGLTRGAYEFGAWEGTLYRFSPATGQGVPALGEPISFSQMLRQA